MEAFGNVNRDSDLEYKSEAYVHISLPDLRLIAQHHA